MSRYLLLHTSSFSFFFSPSKARGHCSCAWPEAIPYLYQIKLLMHSLILGIYIFFSPSVQDGTARTTTIPTSTTTPPISSKKTPNSIPESFSNQGAMKGEFKITIKLHYCSHGEVRSRSTEVHFSVHVCLRHFAGSYLNSFFRWGEGKKACPGLSSG